MYFIIVVNETVSSDSNQNLERKILKKINVTSSGRVGSKLGPKSGRFYIGLIYFRNGDVRRGIPIKYTTQTSVLEETQSSRCQCHECHRSTKIFFNFKMK